MTSRIHVATRKGLFTLGRKVGGTWAIETADFVGDNVSMVLWDPRNGALHAALDHGHFGVKMQRAGTDGAWRETAAPAYPPQPEGFEDKDGFGKPLPWTTLRIWALEPGGPDEAGVLWCGTIPGGLFRSGDWGESWELVRPLWDDPKRKEWFGGGADLPGIHSICVDPRDSRHVRIGISCGGVWSTTDGGATWGCHGEGMYAEFMPPERKYDPNIQDAHRLVQCRTHPDALWVQHHNGIFRSTDGGRIWSDVKDVPVSHFGFAVAVHPSDPNTAWFVPAIKDEKRVPVDGKLVVTRTRDGGRTFDVLRTGLPQTHAYDLIYRHALDVDASGERLAMGSTTGGLWVSEDQGDTWTCVSLNLPPVHAVRWAEQV